MTRADSVLDQALQQPPDAAERFVAEACADDAALHAHVLRLLRLARSAHVDTTLGALLGDAAALALAAMTPPGPARVGAWRLHECLGSGGMAQVFRAERDDGTVAQAAAVKILWPHQLRPDYVWRFAREREILATLDDPRIARYLDGGVADDGRPWLAIELVDGVPLDRYLQRLDLDLDARLVLLGEIAGAVASAHRQMVVHRDLKPANVLVRGDGGPRLLDFGIAALQSGGNDDALTRDYGRLLTPEFASPEQLAGARVDARSDVYQLGRLLHLLLSGGEQASRDRGVLRPPSAVLRDRSAPWPVRARAVRGDLDAIVCKAIDADPDARYASVDALLDDLRRARSGRPIAARDHGAVRRGAKWLRRHWAASGAAAAALLALLAFTLQTARHADAMAHEARLNRDAAAFIENVLMHAGPSQALSEEVLANAAQRAQVDLADQPALRARMLDMLARLRLSRAEMVAGAPIARAAVDAATQAGDHARVRAATITLAELLNYGGDLDTADRLLRDVIAADGEHEDAYVRIVLADVLHSRGAWSDARALAERAMLLNPHGGGPPCMLGMVLRDLGLYADARAAVLRGIANERAREQPSDMMIATCLDCLGQIDLQAGDIAAGVAALERSAALREGRLGERWSGMVWSHHWLGLARHAAGDLDGADRLLTPTVRRYADSFGERSHVLAYARSDLGWLRRTQGRNAEARQLFGQAAQTLQAIGRHGHPRTAEPLLGIALLTMQVDRDPTAARALAERAWTLRRTAMPDGHPARIRACVLLQRLGGQCNDTGPHPPTALEWLRMQPLPDPLPPPA